jgi:hypothetical protein
MLPNREYRECKNDCTLWMRGNGTDRVRACENNSSVAPIGYFDIKRLHPQHWSNQNVMAARAESFGGSLGVGLWAGDEKAHR